LKKPVTILILFILFFSQVGYRLVFVIQQHQLKEEAEEKFLATINDEEFELIDLNANYQDIKWEEEGKEFLLNGQLYDVAKKETKNGKTILYCLNDKKEEQLLNDMAKQVKSDANNSSGNKDGKHTIKFQLSDFISIIPKILSEIFSLAPQKYQEYIATVPTVIKKVNTPPPDNNLYFQKLIL